MSSKQQFSGWKCRVGARGEWQDSFKLIEWQQLIQITTLYNKGMQKSISEYASAAEDHTGCNSCEMERNGKHHSCTITDRAHVFMSTVQSLCRFSVMTEWITVCSIDPRKASQQAWIV